MSTYVVPDRIEDMANELKKYSRCVENSETEIHRMISNLINEIEAEYSESYVRYQTQLIRQILNDIRQYADKVTGNLTDLSRNAVKGASMYRNIEKTQTATLKRSRKSFNLNLPFIKTLKGMYRIVNTKIRAARKKTPNFDPNKDYAALIRDAIKNGDYSNLQTLVDERDAKIASNDELYKNVKTTGEDLLSYGYVGVRSYLNSLGYENDQITYEDGKVCVIVNGKQYPLDILGIALTGSINYASKENIEKALNGAKAPSASQESISHTDDIKLPANFNLYSKNQKVQFYLHYLGFDIKTFSNDKIVNGIQFHKGDPLLDGDLGFQSGAALLIVQAYGNSKKKTVNGKPVEITGVELSPETVDFLASISNEKSELKRFIEEEWKPEEPVIDQKKYKNGYVPKTAFVKVYGDQYLLKEDAVAWAMLVNGAINYNKTETDKTKKFDVNTLKITMGYRDYATQVYVELKQQLEGGNEAANPIWTNSEAAKKWISEHKKDWKTEYMSAIGEGQPLHGVGNSKHGWGLAIDFNTQDPGSEFYRILDKDQEYKGYEYKKGQIVGCEQVQGPKIDSLTAYNEFSGTPKNYGKGAAQTPQVMWLEKNAKNFGFKLYDNRNEPFLEDGSINYSETWHWNYDLSEV